MYKNKIYFNFHLIFKLYILYEGRNIIKTITKIINSLGTCNIIEITSNDSNIIEVLNRIENIINNYNNIWSIYNKDSLISKINNSNDYILVDNNTLDIINKSIYYSNKTKGYFDITTSKINILWKSSIKNKVIPDKKEINKYLKSINYKKISIKKNKIKLGKNQSIDLGGIAKGYILDEIIDILSDYDIEYGLINLGGTIHIIGKSYVGIRNPFNPLNNNINDNYVLKVELENNSIVTSGIYEQQYLYNNISYNHIINPKTGYPCNNNLLSISLIGSNASKLDCYATALFNMNLSDGIRLINEEGIDAIIIFKDGNIFVTDNIKSKIIKEELSEK